MEKQKLIQVVENKEHKSNADLLKALETLQEEFNLTKETILKLTHHLDTVEAMYYKISDELKKRKTVK